MVDSRAIGWFVVGYFFDGYYGDWEGAHLSSETRVAGTADTAARTVSLGSEALVNDDLGTLFDDAVKCLVACLDAEHSSQ